MYAQVVVLTYQPPNIDNYTYEIPKKFEGLIKPGQLVEVPFGKREPTGLVLGVQPLIGVGPLKGITIKSISSIILSTPILLPYQIKLLKWLAFYYHAPMVNCLEAMIPALPSSQFTVHSSQNIRGGKNHQP